MRLKFPALPVLCAALLLALLAGAAHAARAQAIQVPPVGPAGEPQPAATIHQTVNNVLVDVVVTDRNGQPLKGIPKEKFQLLENGAPQPIVYFEEHQTQPAPAPFAHPFQLPPNIYTNVATSAPDTGPTLVLLMDALNTPTTDQVRVRLQMLDYLRKIPSGRSIAIFTLTDKLRMIQGFSSDPAALIAALDQAAAWAKTHTRLNDDPGHDSYADFMPTALPGADARVISNFISHEVPIRMDERVADTLNALTALGTYLSAIPGRKNLIWFSSTFPIAIGDSDNLQATRNYEADLRRTTDLLTVARVAVYPIDPGALATPGMYSASSDSAEMAQDNRIFHQNVTEDTVAEATGGRAFHSTTDLAGAIATVSELGATYYTLAYVPKDKNYDNKYRKLVIKVDEPKVKLDYRRGYYAEDPDKGGIAGLAHPPRTASVLLRGAPAATDILFKVRVAPAEKADPGTPPNSVRYSVNWSVDLRGLDLAQSAGGDKHGKLTLAVVAYNSDAKAIGSTSLPASLILQPDEYRLYLKSGLQFHQELDLPIGPVFLRVAIVNTDNERAGSVEIPLLIKPNAAH